MFFQPENILVASGVNVPCLRLVDFGDAQHIYNSYYIHQPTGPPEFLAPEIINGTPVGLPTDIWFVQYFFPILLFAINKGCKK